MNPFRKRLIIIGSGAFLIIAAGAIAAYLIATNNRISIDTASIQAPLIDLTTAVPGTLNAVYVQAGDTVAANQPVASVGNQIITSKVAGLIVQVNDTIGAQVSPGQTVVEMIDP
ncbi:MAG: hypothetical protein B7W98_00585, partial [Parcubacteria group bacterium 20-58-5]